MGDVAFALRAFEVGKRYVTVLKCCQHVLRGKLGAGIGINLNEQHIFVYVENGDVRQRLQHIEAAPALRIGIDVK